MGMDTRKTRRRKVAAASVVAALAAAGTASAFQALPPGAQVNDDPASGIFANLGVNGEDPTNADVVGGALVAGKPAVPWAVFRQHEQSPSKDQVFSRSFAAANPLANGVWTTRGNGTVGGRSDSGPTHLFSGSLNFDQTQDGEAPSIDFAGAGRAVPWATWYEDTAAFGKEQIFASRFDSASNKWIFSGQSRGDGGTGTNVPSLNIRTGQDAENPSVAGGSAADATKPGPWVTWQETTTLPINDKDQIFVSRPEGPGQANCDDVTPAGVADGTGHVPAIGGFCFQQTGAPRVGPGGADPSLNVDPTRDGIEPDIAFTGKNAAGVQDGVPWVVWYETGNTTNGTSGLTHNNEMVFAAKGLADATPGRGGFSWTAVGNQNSALLDASGTNHFGGCAASDTAEAGCSLNKDVNADAEDPRVASGTMNPANATVPWVAWAEGPTGGHKQIFVSRLVGGTHFELANNGAPVSVGGNDSTRPDITFSGNTPYVSWREDIGGGVTKGFLGHFVNNASGVPVFVLDESNIPLAPTGTTTPLPAGQADVREPISSGCTADPFNQDGKVCQGGAVGTPFFLFTNQVSASVLGLFAGAYQSSVPATGAASSITTNSATVAGSVNPNGASVGVSFQFGTTTNYGGTASAGKTGPDNGVDQFSAQLTGLPAGTIIHYRAVATSDFAPPQFGPDQTFKTAPAYGRMSVGKARVRGTAAFVRVSCSGIAGQTCKLRFRMTVTKKFRGKKLIAVTAKKKKRSKIKKVVVTVGSAPGLTLNAGQSKTVKVSLNRVGKRLLASRHTLKVTLTVTQILTSRTSRMLSQTVTFKAPKKKKHHHH
jgi:hypothetical protein